MKDELTFPPMIPSDESKAPTLETHAPWDATAEWKTPSEATITRDGFTYSLPLAEGPVISSGEMERFRSWLQMKCTVDAFTYELKLDEKSVKYGNALGAIDDLWKLTECDDYLLNPDPYVTHAYFKYKLVTFSLADAFATHLPEEQALERASQSGYGTEYKKVTAELSGGTFSPVKAFAHYLWGNGESLHVNINHIGLAVRVQDIPSLKDAIASNYEPGNYCLSDHDFVYDTAASQATTGAYLDKITLNVEGVFTRYEDTSWAFDAVLTARPKVFDSAADSRAPILQTLTTAGRVFTGQPYAIEITGEQPLQLKGDRP